MLKNRPSTSYRVQRFGENLDRLLAIPAAVDAGLIQPVVNCRLAAGFLEEPLGVGVVGVLVGLAEVEPADDADAACVCFLEYLAERVVPFWDIRAHVVVLDLAGVERRDPAQLHQQHVGIEGGHLFDERPGVQRRIGLAEVGLEPADGLAHPPVRLRRARRPGAEHRCQEHNPHRHPLRSCSECNGTIMNPGSSTLCESFRSPENMAVVPPGTSGKAATAWHDSGAAATRRAQAWRRHGRRIDYDRHR